MNIEKVDYGTVIKFGTWSDFNAKLQLMGQCFDDVVNSADENGVSLLEKCIVARKFDLAREFLTKNAEVNIITKEGYNEFHLIAANIRYDGALDIAKMLLDRDVSLMVRDKKYGNTAFFALCMEIFKIRSLESLEFLEVCFERVDELDIRNKAGISIRMLIGERGTERLKQMMEEKT